MTKTRGSRPTFTVTSCSRVYDSLADTRFHEYDASPSSALSVEQEESFVSLRSVIWLPRVRCRTDGPRTFPENQYQPSGAKIEKEQTQEMPTTMRGGEMYDTHLGDESDPLR